MNTAPLELISHHLCPYLQRLVTQLITKGQQPGKNFTITYLDIRALPAWLYTLSPTGSMPVARMDADNWLLRTMVIAQCLDEIYPPTQLPDNPYERARERMMIFAVGEWLDQLRDVYTAKTEAELSAKLDKLFKSLSQSEPLLTKLRSTQPQSMSLLDFAAAPFFTLAWEFDYLRQDGRWQQTPTVVHWGKQLIAMPQAQQAKCTDYRGWLDRFMAHFNAALAAHT